MLDILISVSMLNVLLNQITQVSLRSVMRDPDSFPRVYWKIANFRIFC